MSTIWDVLKESFNDALGKAEELKDLGQDKIDILKLKNKMTKDLSRLGATIYEMYNNGETIDFDDNDKLKKMLDELKDIEKQLKEKEKKVSKI
ncbi:MAG: hypothetical protein GWP03_02810 [Proteobacteria bacterium]|nr:hypothetical protein [Pseudomonadota bacterium]